ncbi:MAG: hypothetical protein A2289_14465 [Deltaproteobacteria bacterium RIFOXYA12_FULL_58_15]|nr:MAG: hypothetical protein A2289_14465 [Deltaproteobacteria bacterium RIFOXYA12_FULL_58_15]OGR12324.1 MAG: hypothetical protein A2341_15215 [Deltaproteobacteria bacterium RIFOXYB12_FULL_58_9]
MQRIPSDILAPKIPGQRALLVVMLSLIALLMGAGIAAAIRFEQSAAQMYVANLHAVAKLGAIRLEDVFRGAQEMMGVATRCNLTHQASDDQLQEVLSEMYVALQSSGALSVAALQNGRLVEASGTQVKDAALIIQSARNNCAPMPGRLCISHATTESQDHVIVVSGRHHNDGPNESLILATIIDWATVGNRLVENTMLDEWSKAFILDRDGTLLAWPTDTKKPGFSVIDEVAGCAECHQDLEAEPVPDHQTWRVSSLEIAGMTHVVASERVRIGDGHMVFGLVAPRHAALKHHYSTIVWAASVFLVLLGAIGFVLLRLHRMGVTQVLMSRAASHEIHVLNAELERKVDSRTDELRQAHARTQTLQREHAALDRLAAVGELAAVFAHEVRTPLNALSIARQRVERMTRGGVALQPDALSDLLLTQKKEIEIINSYVESYLQYTRKRLSDVGDCEISGLIDEVMGYLRPEAERAHVELSFIALPKRINLHIDRSIVRHIAVNLCLNAIQAQPDGGEVNVRATLANDEFVLEVADRGPGVKAEHIKDIFEPFKSFRVGGTGLGLAICMRLAKEAGATIAYEPRDGGGAVFIMRWPLSLE